MTDLSKSNRVTRLIRRRVAVYDDEDCSTAPDTWGHPMRDPLVFQPRLYHGRERVEQYGHPTSSYRRLIPERKATLLLRSKPPRLVVPLVQFACLPIDNTRLLEQDEIERTAFVALPEVSEPFRTLRLGL